jgi:hypothetical protein
MARRKKKNEQTVSLFPFLSILACIIGSLTLIITALALGQMNTKSEDENIDRAEQYLRIKKISEKERAKIEELKRISAEAIAAWKRLKLEQERREAARKELEKLLQKKKDHAKKEENVKKDKALNDKLLLEAVDLRKRIDNLKDEPDKLKKLIEPLRIELSSRKKPPKEAEVLIQPSGSGQALKLKPSFIECTATGIALLQGEKPVRILAKDIGTDKEYLAIVKKVAADPSQTIIFLIRDDGMGTYGAARGVAYKHYARNGKLPVIGHGKIDISLFKK